MSVPKTKTIGKSVLKRLFMTYHIIILRALDPPTARTPQLSWRSGDLAIALLNCGFETHARPVCKKCDDSLTVFAPGIEPGSRSRSPK